MPVPAAGDAALARLKALLGSRPGAEVPRADHPAQAAPPALLRIFRGFVLARAVLGSLLLVLQALVMSSSHAPGAQPPAAVLVLCSAYALASVGLALWLPVALGAGAPRWRRPLSASGRLRRRWALATLGVDLLAFSLLLALVDPGGGLNIGALFILPALMAAALLPRQMALAVAAGAALVLLGTAGLQALNGPGGPGEAATQLSQAGLIGAAVMVIGYTTAELSERLARQELTAHQSLVLAREQAQLNQLMIEEMQDGVMVVDAELQVRAANPAALALIGAPATGRRPEFSLRQEPAWQPLCRALDLAYASGLWPSAGQEVRLRQAGGSALDDRRIRLRLRFTRRLEEGEGVLCLLFIEDVRQLQARAQQEKLAAMGRISAGIAHEIRNPLAAIDQANALLSEDLQEQPEPGTRQATRLRLLRIARDNAARLKRIVEDVLDVAPGTAREAPVIELNAYVAQFCREWAATAGLQPPQRLEVRPSAEPLAVRFEPDALRRVLINLLDNGLRHATAAPGALQVRLQPQGLTEVLLSVASDGAPIAPEVEPYLFEPFFSTRSRGSGLGLYICRELGERYGATLDYRAQGPVARHPNVFVLTLPRLASDSPSSFTPLPP